jgi:hypothetical protein
LKFTHRGSGAEPDPDFYYEAWTDELWVCCGCEMSTLVHHWELVGAPPEGERDAQSITRCWTAHHRDVRAVPRAN